MAGAVGVRYPAAEGTGRDRIIVTSNVAPSLSRDRSAGGCRGAGSGRSRRERVGVVDVNTVSTSAYFVGWRR